MKTLVLAALGLGLFLAGCSDAAPFGGECKRDSDCEEYEKCDLLDHRCVCASDQACAPGEFCNLSGSCQQKTSCVSNLDCPDDGTFCDVTSGECIEAVKCTTDIQCDIGQICENNLCRSGCRETSDCDLMAREVCVGGECIPGRCEYNSYCEFGKVCNPQTQGCEQPAEPYCTHGCDYTCSTCGDNKEIGPCGDPSIICGRYQAGGETYCWVPCVEHADCPSGYLCRPNTVDWDPGCNVVEDCTLGDDPVVNVCGPMSHRCKLNQQPCETDGDCYSFETTCLLARCVFGYHCEPPGGCQ
jgi:hypothetical protein